MLEELNNYDWAEAFGFAGEQTKNEWGWEQWNHGTPVNANPDTPVDTSPFTREDVVEIIAMDLGANDDNDWVGVFRLADGRYAALEAGCDYTGWD